MFTDILLGREKHSLKTDSRLPLAGKGLIASLFVSSSRFSHQKVTPS